MAEANGKMVVIYIGNLPYSVTGEKLREMFSAHGTVRAARVIADGSGKSKGFGFVEMAEAEAEKAITALHNTQVEGRALVANRAREQEASGKDAEDKGTNRRGGREDESGLMLTKPNIPEPLQLEKDCWHSHSTVQVRARRRAQQSVANVTVLFKWGEHSQLFAVSDESGVASSDLIFDAPGAYTVWVQIEDVPESQVFVSVIVREKSPEEIELDTGRHQADLAEQRKRRALADKAISEAQQKEKTPEELGLEKLDRQIKCDEIEVRRLRAEKDLLEAKKKEEPQLKVPGEVAVKVNGFAGNYRLTISVLERETKEVLKNVAVFAEDSSGRTPLNTGETGFVDHEVKFTEQKRFVSVFAPGCEKSWGKWLYGPIPPENLGESANA